MPINDPWVEIDVPNAVGNFNMNMVDVEGLKCQVFWAVSGDNRCSLLLRTESDYSSVIEPPTLKGLDISYDRTNRLLIYILNDNDQRTIFWSLCNDIIDSTKQAESEEEALNIAINRSWKWHFLLRGGRSGKLSIEEQKGLIGELLVLEGVVMQGMTHSEAISCWLGPFDSPKDFIIGDMGIEVKARRGAAAPFITINSEHQLDSSDIAKLFLHVCHINPSPSDVENGITLDSVVDRIFNQIMSVQPAAIIGYESALQASGYDRQHDYSDSVFIAGQSTVYLVAEEFPSITSLNLAAGITRVRYSLSLVECGPYEYDYAKFMNDINMTQQSLSVD